MNLITLRNKSPLELNVIEFTDETMPEIVSFLINQKEISYTISRSPFDMYVKIEISTRESIKSNSPDTRLAYGHYLILYENGMCDIKRKMYIDEEFELCPEKP